MQYGLRHHGLPLLAGIVKDSMLVDLGYIDGAALCDAYVSAEAGAVIDTSLYEVIAMELGLWTLLGESS